MLDAFKQLEEAWFKKLRKNDINYLIDHKVVANDYDIQAIKQDVSRINSTNALDNLYNYLAVNAPDLVQLKKIVSESLKYN
jgi:hypothetical protein